LCWVPSGCLPGWQACPGISGSFAVEWVAGFAWNQWQAWSGIRKIDFLLGFDRARKTLNTLLDWPRHDLDLFIRVVHQNAGQLSANKRKSHFGWMRDDEIRQAEETVIEAFGGLTKPA
ncbi:hypothetical protein FVW59_07200, partial [Parahaliea aestuarii]